MGNCKSMLNVKTNAKVHVNTGRITIPVYLTLKRTPDNHDAMKDLHAFQTLATPVNPAGLDGIYTQCIVNMKDNTQYLIIYPLTHYQSNHGMGGIFLRKLPGYDKANKESATIIAGGEICFSNGHLVYWNLKSAGFSQNTSYDESNENFITNRERIYLPPEKYQPIQQAEMASKIITENYTPRGSYRLNFMDQMDTTSCSSFTRGHGVSDLNPNMLN